MIPAEPINFWEFFDFYTLGILFVVVGWLIAIHYRKNSSLLGTISQTVADSKYTSLIFSVVMTICFPLYFAFIWFWVGPYVGMPTGFYFLLAVSAICEVIFVWVPATVGRSRKVHQIMSGVVGVAMLAAPIAILAYGKNLDIRSKASIFTFMILTTILGVLLLIKKTRKYTFLYETIYCVTFLVTMSIIAHS